MIYISGPMTGIKDFNKPAFELAEERLVGLGHSVVNPVRNGLPESASWPEHIRADIVMLMSCEIIYMLPGWRKSKGAVLEHHIATGLGMEVRGAAR